jgi:hypothetical protein
MGPRKRKGAASWGRAAALIVAATVVLFAFTACRPYRNPSLGSKPTAPPNAGPQIAPNGESPEQAAARLFPAARAQELALGASPQALKGAKSGRPVPVARDYNWDGRVARWVLPEDQQAVSGNMFAAMWPLAMSKDAFFAPFVKHGKVIGQYYVELHGDSWAYEPALSSSLHMYQLYALQVADDKLRRELGPQTTVRPVAFVPSGLVFAVGDNGVREAAALLGRTWMGPGIGDVTQTKVPPAGIILTPAELKELLAP